MRNQRGFSLVELMITMIIFTFAIVAVANIFTGLMNQFKQQSKIAETNIEGLVGLKMLKADIEQAGFGLPFDVNGATYAEAANDIATVGFDPTVFNDAGAPGNPPRGLLVGNDLTMTNRSDVLVVKATNVAINDAAQKWAYMTNDGAASTITDWHNAAGTNIVDENFVNTDRVVVLRPVQGTARNILQVSGANFSTTFDNITTSDFAPPINSYETYLIYGIKLVGNPVAEPIMPFNRADYYVRTPGTMPSQCAWDTGILYKGTIDHTGGPTGGGGSHTELPLLDCVAAMKVVLVTDTNADGTLEYGTAWAAGTTAADIRSQLKEIRIYILLHEGQRDVNYTSPAQMIITDPGIGAGAPLLTYNVPDRNRNYRWKIYTMVMTPYNLR